MRATTHLVLASWWAHRVCSPSRPPRGSARLAAGGAYNQPLLWTGPRRVHVGYTPSVRRRVALPATERHPLYRSMNVQTPVVLAYLGQPDARPRWVTRLGIASLVLGILYGLGGTFSVRDPWQYVFDPTFKWAYPPPRWVPVAHLGSVALVAVSFIGLAIAGLVSLVKPVAVARAHLAALSLVIPAVVASSTLRVLELRPHPAFGTFDLCIEWLFECAVALVYPAIALYVVIRKLAASRGSPVAV